ncbi:MAG: efflux RND transporter permease subunit [Verrucomicrobiota bacterium]|nr:efflux RND transporter permease subunit [Verrucomicrobiota bacterium]
MFLSKISIKRPIAMSCLLIALTLLGLNSYRKLGLELMPKLDIPYITIATVYPGASPKEIEPEIAKRIEDAVVTIDGLKHVNSSCMENVCMTILEFQLGVDVDIAATDVREKLSLIREDLPVGAEDPKIQKFDINATPIVTLALSGDYSLDELYDYADNYLSDHISVIQGVADVQLIGGAKREVHIKVDRDKLASRNLTSLDLVQTIRQNIGTIPSGHIRDKGIEYSVIYDADYNEPVDIGSLEVSNNKGQRIYLRDLATISFSTEELRQEASLNNKPCIAIKVIKRADANAVEVAEKIAIAMSKLKDEVLSGMQLDWVTGDDVFIKATNESAWINVFQGIILTAGILFLFLYNLRALLVVIITMPLTIVVGLFFMNVAGFTINTSTLIAIGMSVGILVTNSIVVLEAIIKRINKSGNPKKASLMGAGEVAIAVFASAITNMVVLFPLAFMKSAMGSFIKPLALTMLIMTLVSLFISFTLTPILCSLILKKTDNNSKSPLRWMEKKWNGGFDEIINIYRRILQFNENHRFVAILIILSIFAMLIHSFKLAKDLGSSMVQEADKGEIFVKMEFPTNYTLKKTKRRVAEAELRLKKLPELKHILVTTGKVEGIIGQSSEGVYLTQVLLKFSERTERSETIHELLMKTRKLMSNFPDAIITVSMPSLIGGQNIPIQMVIAGDNLKTLDDLAIKAKKIIENIPGILEPDTTVRYGKPELRIKPNRAVLSDYGLSAANLGYSLRGNLEGLDVGTLKQSARSYDIVLKFTEQEGKNQIRNFEFPNNKGLQINLNSIANLKERNVPININRKDKKRVSKIFANLSSSLSLGTAVEKITQEINKEISFPDGYSFHFQGDYEFMSEAQKALVEAALISMMLIFLSLAAILESFKQPFLILVTVPLAFIGMVWALSIFGGSIGIFEIMGYVMMIGIVVNNAILIMDQFNIHVKEGIPRHKAMITASCERFRPVVMITFAAVLGMLPLAFGRGIGAEIRNGVGLVSAGGILVSGILTLVAMPILYDLCTMTKKKKK